jgi:hypothetical protein
MRRGRSANRAARPNYDAVIECLPTCAGPDDPPRYPPIVSSEHRLQKYPAGLGAAGAVPASRE